MSEQVRGWVYRVGIPVIGLAGIYGIVNEKQAAGWVALLAAIATNGLAAKNTSVRRKTGSAEGETP